MTAPINPSQIAPLGFTGIARLQLDDGNAATIWAFPSSQIGITIDQNNAYPGLIDSSAVAHNKNPGFLTGRNTQSGPIAIDRLLNTFLTKAFGPRSGNLIANQVTPFIATYIPEASAAGTTQTGVFFNTMVLTGRFGIDGRSLMVTLDLEAMVSDPTNIFAASALAAGSGEGTAGAGLSSFATVEVNDGAASDATIYDQIRAFRLTLTNGLLPMPSSAPTEPTSRIIAGYSPSLFMGTLELQQGNSATNALPQGEGVNPFNIVIPSGDGTHTLTVKLATSFDRESQPIFPNEFNTTTTSQTIFGGFSANGTSAWPAVFTYT